MDISTAKQKLKEALQQIEELECAANRSAQEGWLQTIHIDPILIDGNGDPRIRWSKAAIADESVQ